MNIWKPVTAHTRAPHSGTIIKCLCGEEILVFHFAWSGIQCIGCKKMIDKNDWKVAA